VLESEPRERRRPFESALVQPGSTHARLTGDPIVLGGCGRSGTSLLLSVLSCHPHVFAIPRETRALSPAPPKFDVSLDFAKLDRLLAQYEIPVEATRWCEKTPKNVLFFGRILDALGPRVRVIHVVRDGRDVVTSSHPASPKDFWVPTERWVGDVSAGLAYADHPQVLTVRYEDLVTSFEPEVRRICSFLGEEFVESFLCYPESARVRETADKVFSARPIDRTSIGRWRNPEYRNLIRRFMRDARAVELLVRLGYSTADPRPSSVAPR
jgi:Sulfotransferase family